MKVDLCVVTWETIAALATFAAVIVALIPIWREARRREAHARSLRFRLGSKLTLLRPTLLKVAKGGQSDYPSAVLSKDEFREAVGQIDALLQETTVLEPDEQNALGAVFFNLEPAAKLYETKELTTETAKNLLKLVDEAISAMDQHPLFRGEIKLPWDND